MSEFLMPDLPAKVRDACDRCHSKKMRCQRVGARCERCQQAGVSCVFSPRTPYNAVNRTRNSTHGSKDSSLSSHNTTGGHTETPSASNQTTNSLTGWNINGIEWPSAGEWNLGSMGLLQASDAEGSSSTTASPQFFPPATLADINDVWIDASAPNLVMNQPASPTLLCMPPDTTIAAGVQDLRSTHDRPSTIADISTQVFRAPGLHSASGHITIKESPSDRSLPASEFYCETFAASRSLVKALGSYGDAPPDPGTADDADLLLVLSSYLKLLGRYDAIFGCWLPLIEPEVKEPFSRTRSSALRDVILHVLPPANSMASLLGPIATLHRSVSFWRSRRECITRSARV
ncbi:unnamed protein product [Periconia digitata]|uniref:Zn(2)-C6 fungal-type domain-containing protein n=1 Tax=Periconia digitata TaxID=1303443 RepID=A0A9W4UKK4_9PLEO|nr:unnamed protein product [Periconia digitata]